VFQVAETFRDEGASGVFRRGLPSKQTAVKTRLMLSKLKPDAQRNGRGDEACLEISRDRLDSGQLRYLVKSRYLKARRNLQLGYRGFALADKDEVLGDVWYVTNADRGAEMPDLEWLDIRLSAEDVYLFDMHLVKEHRGGGTARLLLAGALRQLKEKGYRTAYGYYVSHNIPALWIHRMLGYEEVSRIVVRRTLGRCRRVNEEQGAERRNS